jgi:hypothetical protein
MRAFRVLASAGAVLLAAGTLACSGSDAVTGPSGSSATSSGPPATGSPVAGGGTPSAGSSTGTLEVHLTDSPFSDAKALLVTFTDVSVHRADPGEWRTLPFAMGSSRTCDLKKLNGATDVLGVGSLPAGKYTQVRLDVGSAVLYFDNPSAGPACAAVIASPAGKSAPVDIPSGEVKLNNEFTVTGSATTMLLDFDGDQSIHQTGSGNGNGNGGGQNGKYMMSPVIRVVSVQ